MLLNFPIQPIPLGSDCTQPTQPLIRLDQTMSPGTFLVMGGDKEKGMGNEGVCLIPISHTQLRQRELLLFRRLRFSPAYT